MMVGEPFKAQCYVNCTSILSLFVFSWLFLFRLLTQMSLDVKGFVSTRWQCGRGRGLIHQRTSSLQKTQHWKQMKLDIMHRYVYVWDHY